MFPAIEKISTALNENFVHIDWLAGDGSDRSYYRITTPSQKTFILMQLKGQDALNLLEGRYDWINIALFLKNYGISAPQFLHAFKEEGALIIEDYGDETLESAIVHAISLNSEDHIFEYYNSCTTIIGRFLNLPKNPHDIWCQRSFDQNKLTSELLFFKDNLIKPLATSLLSHQEQELLLVESASLAKYLAPLSKYFTHRDYHSRNLMYKNHDFAVIDFQDARIGAAAYDLVSLVFDSYVPFETPLRKKIFAQALEVLRKQVSDAIFSEIEESWPAVLLQRQLKAIGSFGYLTLKKNRGNYLKYLPRALDTLKDIKSMPLLSKNWPFLSDQLITHLYKINPPSQR